MSDAISRARAIAAAATPGPWGADSIGYAEDDVRVQVTCGAWDLALIDESAPPELRDTSVEQRIADAAHVATFDPPTVSAMLDVIEAAERVIAPHAFGGVHAEELGAHCEYCRRSWPCDSSLMSDALDRVRDLFGGAE